MSQPISTSDMCPPKSHWTIITFMIVFYGWRVSSLFLVVVGVRLFFVVGTCSSFWRFVRLPSSGLWWVSWISSQKDRYRQVAIARQDATDPWLVFFCFLGKARFLVFCCCLVVVGFRLRFSLIWNLAVSEICPVAFQWPLMGKLEQQSTRKNKEQNKDINAAPDADKLHVPTLCKPKKSKWKMETT